MTAKDLIQHPCRFFTHDGKELHGMITEAVEAPPFGVGQIPDFLVTVRGQSGQTKTVSLVQTHLRTTDT